MADNDARPRRSRATLAPMQRVWVLNLAIASTAVGCALLLSHLRPISAPVRLDWWGVAILVYLGELAVVHLRFRRDAHSYSMSEIPLVLGLFFAHPGALLIGQLVGNAVVLTVNRRQPAVKLIFNLGQFTLQTALAVGVFQSAVRFGDPLGPAGWIGALLATVVALIPAHLLINTAIRLSGGRIDRDEMLDVLTLGAVAAVINGSLALIGVTVVWRAPDAAWLAAVPPIVLFMAYRAYISQREERSRLEALYQASRVLHESPHVETALMAAAIHARSTFDAEQVQIVVLPHGPERDAYVTSIGPGELRRVMEPFDIDGAHRVWSKVISRGEPELIRPDTAHPPTQVGIRDAIVAPLTGDAQVVGAVLVANRLGDISSFRVQDLRLLETLASQISVSLENGRLEDSLAELTALKEELKHQALHDALTGLANRTLFAEHVEHALNTVSRSNEQIGVLFLDLDDFKTINDSLGHAAGDELLVAVASRLRATCRPSDTVARLGGDEFAVLLERTRHPAEAVDVAQRIIDRLLEPLTIEGQEIATRTSIGIAIGKYGDDPDGLLRNADAAMYAAKRRGKGQCRVFEAGMHAEVIRRLELQADLQRAIEDDELVIQYQPIVMLENGEILGFEALIRWDHPTRGQVMPERFVAFAEETGLIVDIGRWVLNEACRHASVWFDPDGNDDGYVSVNLSPRQLTSDTLLEDLATALRQSKLAPRRLVLEITENVLMNESVLPVMERLRDLGVRLAIDDFGTGYSSLSYLDRLPIDIIKVDQSFVQRLSTDRDETPLVRTVVGIGTSLGLTTIVEGIETEHQMLRLQELGCRIGQGFYLAEPLTRESVDLLLPARSQSPISRRHLRAVG